MSNFHALADIARALANPGPKPGTAGVVRRLILGEFATGGVVLSRESKGRLHRQPNHEEMLLVVDGEADFRVGDEVRRVRNSDLVFIPRNALHGTVATITPSFAFLSIFAPQFDLSRDVIWEGDESAPPRYELG
jgi:quercetin dioxygenase-like cupin family protein